MKKLMIIFIVFLWKSISTINAQTTNHTFYINGLPAIFDIEEHKHDHAKFIRETDNEAVIFFGVLYWTYKNFISSQDVESCVFVPSCSTYMMLAIQKHGAFIGFLDGMDRLTRCGPFANGRYPFNPKYKKYEDPVD